MHGKVIKLFNCFANREDKYACSCLRVKRNWRDSDNPPQIGIKSVSRRVLAVHPRAAAAVVEMPSHGPGLRSFFFPHRRYCTSIFIPPHVPARRPARGGREKMQPPNTIDRYKHTRATITDVCYSAYNVSRASPGSQYAKGDRKRSTHRCPLSFDGETRWSRKRDSDGPGDRERERRTRCVTRARV